jgi:spore germination cell wall hydrolase CwlJ-like protein
MIRLKDILNEIMEGLPPPAIVQQHTNTHQTPIVNQKDIDNAYILAATLWGEARGEGLKGMQAVLNVIINRANGNISTASQIVLQPKQFSFWNGKSDPRTYAHQLANSKRGTDKLFDASLVLVDKAMKGQLTDITGGSTFYFNPHIIIPKWAKSMKKTITIGNHDFYKLPDKKAKIK